MLHHPWPLLPSKSEFKRSLNPNFSYLVKKQSAHAAKLKLLYEQCGNHAEEYYPNIISNYGEELPVECEHEINSLFPSKRISGPDSELFLVVGKRSPARFTANRSLLRVGRRKCSIDVRESKKVYHKPKEPTPERYASPSANSIYSSPSELSDNEVIPPKPIGKPHSWSLTWHQGATNMTLKTWIFWRSGRFTGKYHEGLQFNE